MKNTPVQVDRLILRGRKSSWSLFEEYVRSGKDELTRAPRLEDRLRVLGYGARRRELGQGWALGTSR